MSDDQTITVTGNGVAPVEPDVVVAALGVEVVADSPAAAFEQCGAVLAQVRAALLASGVPQEHVQTTRLALQPEWEHAGGRPRPSGYHARAGIGLSLHDPQRLGALLDAVVDAGGDAARVHTLNWRASDPVAAEGIAREAAFTDARRRAEHYATLAGRGLGEVRRIAEGGFDVRPGHRHMGVALAASAAMEIDPGEVDVTSTVTVTWELT